MGLGYWSDELGDRFIDRKGAAAGTGVFGAAEQNRRHLALERGLGLDDGWGFGSIVQNYQKVWGIVNDFGQRLHPDYPSGSDRVEVWNQLVPLAVERSADPESTRRSLGLPVQYPFTFWGGEGVTIASFEAVDVRGKMRPVDPIIFIKWDDGDECEIPAEEINFCTSNLFQLDSYWLEKLEAALHEWFEKNGVYED
mgnify:CR=1 FL=1